MVVHKGVWNNKYLFGQWQRPDAEFGGTEKIFADQNFWMTFFWVKISIFTAKNSDDFFVFTLSFQILRIFTV